jgi:hypothetical protein
VRLIPLLHLLLLFFGLFLRLLDELLILLLQLLVRLFLRFALMGMPAGISRYSRTHRQQKNSKQKASRKSFHKLTKENRLYLILQRAPAPDDESTRKEGVASLVESWFQFEIAGIMIGRTSLAMTAH